MKAVMYLRVSTKEQAEEGYSIAAQQAACVRHIADHGWDLADAYIDRGESARTADRPQFQAMLQQISGDRSIRYLVVHKLDRLARNIKDYATVREMLEKAGVQLVSVTEGLEATPSGRMVEGMLAVVAEWYSNNLSTEIRKGQAQKVREGGWPTHAPVGYRNVRIEGAGGQRRGRATIVPDKQAPLVGQAFELYATGEWSLSALRKEMHTRGLRNRGTGPMTRSGLCDMLKNVAYIGKVPWRGEVHDGSHEPIVPTPLFERVQQVLAGHDRAKVRQRTHTHYLKGLLRCGSCESQLIYNIVKNRKREDFAYFVCASNFNDRTKCGESYAPVPIIEAEVEELYRRVKLPQGTQERFEQMLQREMARKERHRAHATQFIAKRLQRLAGEKEKLVDLYLAGDIDRATFRARKERLESEVVELEGRMTDDTIGLKQARELFDTAVRLTENCHESFIKGSQESKRRWSRAMFAEIVVHDRHIANHEYQEPFRLFLEGLTGRGGSNKELLVEVNGLEPSAVVRRSHASLDGLAPTATRWPYPAISPWRILDDVTRLVLVSRA